MTPTFDPRATHRSRVYEVIASAPGGVTRSEVATRLGSHLKTVSRMLYLLKQDGLVQCTGCSCKSRWTVRQAPEVDAITRSWRGTGAPA